MDISDRITDVESSGDPTAPAKTSSALGLGQFLKGTWLDMIRRYKPDLARGKSNADILAMRTDPVLSKEMTANYAAENEAALRRAGLPVTPGSTYLMHFAGPGGGVKLMKADPDAPVEAILGDQAIKANSFLQGKTAGWVIDWANKKMARAPAPKSRPSAQPALQPPRPLPYLAQAQAVEPAFNATGWQPHSTSPNVLSPDGTRPSAGAPRAAAIPFRWNDAGPAGARQFAPGPGRRALGSLESFRHVGQPRRCIRAGEIGWKRWPWPNRRRQWPWHRRPATYKPATWSRRTRWGHRPRAIASRAVST